MRAPILPMSIAAAAVLAGPAAAQMGDMASTARYRVSFERTWSSETHPQDFPLLAHFSPVIGATHGSGFQLFREGGEATPGLEKLCEEGKHQPLDDEIRDAVRSGHAGSLIETMEPIRDVPARAEADIEVDSRHPMVSIAAMIAPSPDWCAVATGVSLLENGSFVEEKTVPLVAWDVGTDSATSYRAFDSDMQPRGPVRPSDAAYFRHQGAEKPVGRVRFTRIR